MKKSIIELITCKNDNCHLNEYVYLSVQVKRLAHGSVREYLTTYVYTAKYYRVLEFRCEKCC